MENIGSLFFELSNDERMMILYNLDKKSMRLSQLVKKQEMTPTEASRHLQRLTDIDLIVKDADNFYKITPYGRLVLSVIPSLSFLFENRLYFKEHDTSVIPQDFIARFGELSEYTYSVDTISNFAHHEQISKEAEEFCWTVADQFHWSAPRIVNERVKEGIDFRSVLPENLVPPVGFKPAEGVKRRVYPNLNVCAIASDKEAVFGLPYLNGRMDYAQFFSKDPRFIKWCKDLCAYFWDRGKPMTFTFPDNS